MIDTEALQSSEAPSPRTSMGIDNINIAEHISNDLSVAELQNTSENKVKKSSRKNKKKTSKKSSSTSKSKKSSKSKKTQKKIKDNNGESDASSNNSETSDDDSSESSESSSDSSSDETSSSSSSSSDSSSSSSNSSSGKKKSSKKNKFSIQKHPLYIRSFDDVNGTFIDHRPSMTEPVLKNKKKSMMKKRRERKKKAKAERQKEIAKQSEETNPSSNHTNKGKNGNGGLETVHEEPESNGDKANRNKLIADLQVHLTEGFEKQDENDQATNQDSQSKYGSINNKNAENKAKDKYRGRNHFSMGYPPERTNSIDQQMDTSFDELRLAKKKSNDSNNNDIGNLGSKPPSSNSNSSDASSLGDVCLPITSDSEYYISDINSDEENNESIGSSKSRRSKRSQSDGDSDNKSTINSKGFDGSRYEKEIMNNIFDLNKLKNKFDKKNNEDEIHNLQSSKTNTTTSSLRNKNKRRKKTSVKKEWPDISVLEEFSKDETYKLKKQALDNNRNIRNMMSPDLCYDNIHARGLNNQSPVVMNAGFGLTNQASQPQEDTESNASSSVAGFQQTIGFKNPLVSNVDVPELGNAKINETELLKNKNIKNSRFQAWKLTNKAQKKLLSAGGAMVDRSAAATNTIFGTDIPKLSKTASNYTANITKHNTDINENTNFLIGDSSVIQYPPQIISNNPEHFRFAYFRDDMESTVHSPTISGLLQPGQSFRDLFVGEHYKKNVDYDESDFDSEGNLKFDEDNNYTAPFWLDVLNPTEEEMKVISKSFGIHPLTAEDIFQGEAREKVELFKDYYLVCFRSFDIVAERHSRDNRSEKSGKSRRSSFSTVSSDESAGKKGSKSHGVVENLKNKVFKFIGKNNSSKNNHPTSAMSVKSSSRGTNNDARSSYMSKQQKEKELDEYKKKSGSRHKPRSGELEPLNVYILVFRTGVLTFHFAPTPHPINVRRRARLIRDYMDVSSDWVAYALIDDITDSFAPIIEIIEDEVYDIEEEILKMHNPDAYDSDDDSDSDSDYSDFESSYDEKMKLKSGNISKKTRSMSTVDDPSFNKDTNNVTFGNRFNNGHSDLSSMSDTSSMTGYSRGTSSTSSSDSTSIDSNIILWKRKGDMLRRIAECRKRVMSVSRLLGSKADVIKSFAKRCNEDWEVAPRSDIGMYLGDIQDHIVTMVSSLNHFEKLLSRSHSNYLAQINIDMTKVNNDMNDVLGKITILGTAVLPLNVITGLWGMNCIVPGQKYDNLGWFFGIVGFMIIFTAWSVWYTKKKLSF